MKTMKELPIVMAAAGLLGLSGSYSHAGCSTNETPSSYSCCEKDSLTSRYYCALDQEGQTGANVYCHQICKYEQQQCTFTIPASHGCASSGSYSNVFKCSWPGTKYECTTKEGKKVEYYEYGTGSSLEQQGETTKYIIDENNC